MKTLHKIVKEIEALSGPVFISITIVLVIVNVFIRYFFSSIQFAWLEEVAVGCFTWTVFLGATASYRKRNLIGVEAFVLLLPKKARKILRIITDVTIIIILGVLAYLSYDYITHSKKITAVLEFPYYYIDVSMFISFVLMTLYTIKFTISDVRSFKDTSADGLNTVAIEEVV